MESKSIDASKFVVSVVLSKGKLSWKWVLIVVWLVVCLDPQCAAQYHKPLRPSEAMRGVVQCVVVCWSAITASLMSVILLIIRWPCVCVHCRTPGTGLYDNLQQYKIPYAEAIFDIDYFRDNPRPFYTLAQELFPTGKYQPNLVHYFIRLLHCKGLLCRVYTQNIDGLERCEFLKGLFFERFSFSWLSGYLLKSGFVCTYTVKSLTLEPKLNALGFQWLVVLSVGCRTTAILCRSCVSVRSWFLCDSGSFWIVLLF